MALRVLIIDDESSFADMLAAMLRREGYEPRAVYLAADGLDLMGSEPYELVLCDIKMPHMNGLEFLDAMEERGLRSTVIIMSAFGTIDLAIEALRRGAYDYISKPFQRDEVLLTLRKAEERERLRARVAELEGQVASMAALEDSDRPLLGESESMRRLKETLLKVAGHPTTVLVTGASGTGKELVARAIHRLSPRAEGPFVAINCGAIPESLLESELFGHMRGAFTDAHQDKAGLFREASGGTLLLDEVGELPPAMQVGLLRVLQEGEIRPVGSAQSVDVDVRVVAATHRNLEDMVEQGTFREDLFYRLNVLPVHVPSLRERLGDLPALTAHILGRVSERLERPVPAMHPDTLKLLCGYPWPGNVRELENVLERAMILADGDTLGPDDLPPQFHTGQEPTQAVVASGDLTIKRASAYIERELIQRALRETGGNRTHAAKLLEISHRSLLYKLKEYGIS